MGNRDEMQSERDMPMPRSKDVTESKRKKFMEKTCHKRKALRDPKEEISRGRLGKRNRKTYQFREK